MDEEKWIVYFEKPGIVNTTKTLELAQKRAQELGIKTVVVTSTHGHTAQKALELYKGTDLRFIVVGTDREFFSQEVLLALEETAVPVLFSEDVDYTYPELVRNALKKLSEGMKVCLEVCMVAADAGLISEGEEVIAVAGTSSRGFENGGGADTAVVLLPRTSANFGRVPEKAKRRDVKELICKPR